MKRKVKGTLKGTKYASSEIVSYVLLIVITISISIGVFAWIKSMADTRPPSDCEAGTGVLVNNIGKTQNIIEVELLNNGRFNVDGVILNFGTSSQRIAIDFLLPVSSQEYTGLTYINFKQPLKPAETITLNFNNRFKNGSITDIDNIKTLKVQAFVIHNNKDRILCTESVINQNI